MAWYMMRSSTDLLARYEQYSTDLLDRYEQYLASERKHAEEALAAKMEIPPEVEKFTEQAGGMFGSIFKDFNKIFGG